MSDTSFTAVSSSLERTQIYDDEWMMDNLSDDDIDIPKQFEMTEEDDEAQDPCLEEKLEDVWDELCLDQFLDTLNQNHGSSTSNNTNGAASQAAAVATGRSPVRNT